MTGDRADASGRARLRALFEDAAEGLGADDREVIELRLRQGLADSELAAVLGVSPGRAHLLLARASSQLEACLGVLLVGRSGRGDCGDLARLLTGWDGRLTAALHPRVHRHIEHCVTCAARRAAELDRGRRLAGPPARPWPPGRPSRSGPGLGLPAELRARTITLAAGHGPAAAAYGSAVLGRTAPFGPAGFPRAAGRRLSGHGQAVIVATAVLHRRRDGHGPGRRADLAGRCRATRSPDRPVPGAPALAHRMPSPAPPAAAGAGPRLVPGTKPSPYSTPPTITELDRIRPATASTCATARLSHRSWQGIPQASPRHTTSYAGDLYGYCQSLLREPDDAADAVQDTFVIAASKLAGLRDPDRLRAWLFAVARNECLHRLKSRRDAASAAGCARAGRRQRWTSAARPSAPRPSRWSARRSAASTKASATSSTSSGTASSPRGGRRARRVAQPRLLAVLPGARPARGLRGVLLVGRAGRRDCAALDGLLGDWDGRLTALLRKRVGRHIDQCRVCSDRRRRELTPALLYSLSPGGAARPGGAAGSVLTAAPGAGRCPGCATRCCTWPRTPPRTRRHRSGHRAKHALVRWQRLSQATAPRLPRRRAAPHMPFTVVGGRRSRRRRPSW